MTVQGGDRQLARARAEGRPTTGPSPVDRAKPGSKYHLITEAHGIPLAVSLTGGQRNDVTQLMPLIAAIPPVRGRRGRPRQRPGTVYADRGYDHDKYRRQVRAKGVTPVIARRGTAHGSGLGAHRWVVEQSLALLHWFRRLRIRWGDPRRHPRGLPQPGLRHHLLAPAAEPPTLSGALSPAWPGLWHLPSVARSAAGGPATPGP